jgi:hypothetical protein
MRRTVSASSRAAQQTVCLPPCREGRLAASNAHAIRITTTADGMFRPSLAALVMVQRSFRPPRPCGPFSHMLSRMRQRAAGAVRCGKTHASTFQHVCGSAY